MPLIDTFTRAHDRENDLTALTPEHLAGFRNSQRIAYDAATEVERGLEAGMTEHDAAKALHQALARRGVREYFHQPFAWFGERAAFTDFRHVLEFFPTRKRLERGMPVILDVAPIVDGHAADIGYACKLGENALHDQMLDDLAAYRTLILEGVRQKQHLDAIYREVDRLIVQQGYQNRHKQYPFRVLAHRVSYVPERARSEFRLAGFGAPALSYLFGQIAQVMRGAEHFSPLWNDGRSSRHPADVGIWAVEPHLGFRGVGVKWEELLVVTEDDAYWLDDELPHVQRWKARGLLRKSARPSSRREVHA